jgi:colanic acid/amylovoran biosynthesis glycosyltransferase
MSRQAPAIKIGYLIPEFPGQTHTFIWRELSHLRQWGLQTRLYSTQRPHDRIRAKHAFAGEAAAETVYLWPPKLQVLLGALLWAIVTRPVGLLRCVALALTLPIDAKPGFVKLLPLILPASIMARDVVRNGVTRLHCHTSANGCVIAMMVQRLTGVPFSQTLHGDLHWWGGAMAQKFAESDFIMVITKKYLQEMGEKFPSLRPDQTFVAGMGVDTTKWKPVNRPRVRQGPFKLVTVARLHESKGHDVTFKAVRSLLDSGRSVQLNLVGEGPERPALEALIAQLKLQDNVKLLGSCPEERVMAEIDAADAFVLASHAEPLGVVYMEAMAKALPTIGTAAGGVPELIEHGTDGLLVPPHDPVALAAVIAQLIDDPALCDALGQKARQTVIDRFDSRISAGKLYQRWTGSPAPAAASNATPTGISGGTSGGGGAK